MEYDNTNRGSLFKNDRKQADTHADYNGSVNVNGQEFWLNAWLKTAKSGQKFMSLSVKPKDQQAAPKPQQAGADYNIDGIDDDCPF